jgi:hypothetical protein
LILEKKGTCHFDVLLCVLFDVLDIYTGWVVPNALGKGVVLCFETGEEVLDACEHCPSKCDMRKVIVKTQGGDAHSLGGSTANVFRSPKSKMGGAALEDVLFGDEEMLICSSRLPTYHRGQPYKLNVVAGMRWVCSPILCCLFSSSSTSSFDPECDMMANLCITSRADIVRAKDRS